MTNKLEPLTFPINGLRLMEASAGTGKTYTIGALYLRLVLGHGGKNGFHRPLMPPEILVVTFTNAATEELRDRIRKKIMEAAAFFRGEFREAGFLDELGREFPRSSWAEKAADLERAALWMDEAAIHTIHGWSSRMLRQHAFECANLFDLELAPDDQELLEEASRDYWRNHFYGLDTRQLAELLPLIGCTSPQTLLDRVKPLLSLDLYGEEDPFQMLEKRCQAIDKARRQWSVDTDNPIEKVMRAKREKTLNGSKYSAPSLQKWVAQITAWVENNGPLPETQALYRFSSTGLKEGANKHKTPPEHPAFDAFDRLTHTLNQLQIESALLVHAANQISSRYQRQKDQRKLVDFDDLLTRLNEALQRPGSGKLAQIIADQFPVAMIDEFQDTDPVQYAIFKRIYGERPKTALLMIGDPKQAIYAFRGADIHTYLRARNDTGDAPYTLSANYRATEALVMSVNTLFGLANPFPEGPFLFKDQIPFEPVLAKGPKGRLVVKGQPSSGIHIRQLRQNEPVPKTGSAGYLECMAGDFADEVVRLLTLAEQHPSHTGIEDVPGGFLAPIRPSDIAVLVRSGTEAESIQKALYKRNLRSVYLSDKASVFDSDEARQMLYLIRACAFPGEARTLKAALATPILRKPLADLNNLIQDEAAWDAEAERFGRYHSIWRHRGILPMLRNLLQDFGGASGLLSTPEGERAITNFLHLAELLQAKSLEMDGPAGLMRWLEEQIQQHPPERAEQVLRLESDEELIKVITVHKSKGLQYPLVFLPFVCAFRRTTQKDVALATYRDEEGGIRLKNSPDAEDIEAADHERLAEDLRLLYVAVTRAQYACWMGVGVTGRVLRNGEENSQLHRSAFGYLLSGGESIPTRSLKNKLLYLRSQCPHITIIEMPEKPHGVVYRAREETLPLKPALSFDKPVFRDWWITSYSGIVKSRDVSAPRERTGQGEKAPFDFPVSATEDQLREPGEAFGAFSGISPGKPSIHNFPRGPEPGTFLHGLLEWAANEGFDQVSRDPQWILQTVKTRCELRGWGAWTDPVTRWFRDLIEAPLYLPNIEMPVRLSGLTQFHCQPELEFLFAARRVNVQSVDHALIGTLLPGETRPPLQNFHINGMLKGFIDLVFEFQGRYYVLDYKSNHLGENTLAYGPKALADAMLTHRYDLQYVLYTLALHRLLKARLPGYRYQEDMGGAVYLFLRGVDRNNNGVYTDKPPKALIEQLDRDFRGEEATR